jgi:two-component system sensor histidine kinase MprB
MTLRVRLAVAFAALAAVVAGLMGALGYAATANRIQQEVDNSLVAAAQRIMVGPPLSASWRPDPHDPPTPQPRLRGEEGMAATLVSADGRYTVVRSADGAVIAPVPADAALAASEEPRSRARTQDVGGAPFRVVAATDGNGRAAVLVGRDYGQEQSVLRALAVIMALLAFGLAVAAALVGWWLARRIAARLEDLTATAEQVSDTGRLDVPVPGSGSDEVGRLAGAFNTMLGRLAQSRADQQRLVQDAGHELRTPLTSLRTNISLLERYEELTPDVRRRVLADLRGESRELSHLVDELLDAATGGMDDSDPEPVLLADVVDRVVDRMRRKTDRTLQVECDSTTVMGRAGQLERALWNLVDNAAKFDSSGSPVSITVADGVLSVADRGPGIPAEDSGHIFERFYRPVTSRSLPGSGLGLAIVKDVAASHGAAVSVEPRSGGGTVFLIRFPGWTAAG